jgi:hypothetical protein
MEALKGTPESNGSRKVNPEILKNGPEQAGTPKTNYEKLYSNCCNFINDADGMQK